MTGLLAVLRRSARSRGCRGIVLGALTLAGVLAPLGGVATAEAETASQTFTYTGGEQTFTVPAGVSSLQVLAVGGTGGSSARAGGAPARVSGELSVTPGETIYVEVGGNGQNNGFYGSGGFNGGGEGAGGGAGASDVRTSPRAVGLSPDDRLLVAGGGGGSGANGESTGGGGGAAGEAGGSAPSNEGGGAGTQSSGGSGGSGGCVNGSSGQLGMGGAGGECNHNGGGGGGGYYGGGGGGGASGNGGGGGGGGSSLVPAGGSVELASPGTEPQIQISYNAGPVAPTVVTEPASGVTQTAATLNATVNPQGQTVNECKFEYGPTALYGSEVPCETSPGSGESPVAVAASVAGLSPKSVYHFRIIATSAGGTSYGSDRELETLPNPPAVTRVSPAAGFESGGTSVTITGTGFSEATAVKFGSTNATSFTINSATSITAVAPAQAPGAVNVTVANPGGTSTTGAANQFTYVAPGRTPTITALSVKKGPAAGGTSVTITGTSFVGVTAVKFGSTNAASYEVNSPTSITAISPPETTGTVEVTVTTPNGESGITPKAEFTFEAPTVTSLSPNTESQAGGGTVTVTGSGFGIGGSATTFKFGKTPGTSVNCTTTTTCTVVAPAATNAGTVDVTTTVNGMTSKANPPGDQFTYKPPPAVTALLPNEGAAAGGTSVTITGTGFAGATAVKFGSTSAASYVVNSETSITAVSPAATTGTVDVTVTSPNGESKTTSKDHFTFEAPTVTNVSPNTGSKGGGTSVTVTGSGFGLGSSATTFKFGSTLAILVNCTSTTTCTMLSPAVAKTGTVEVTAKAGGKSSSANPPADQFTYE